MIIQIYNACSDVKAVNCFESNLLFHPRLLTADNRASRQYLRTENSTKECKILVSFILKLCMPGFIMKINYRSKVYYEEK